MPPKETAEVTFYFTDGTKITRVENLEDITAFLERHEEYVKVVRCKDCKWWEHQGWYSGWCKQYQGSVTNSEEFCARGKRRDKE